MPGISTSKMKLIYDPTDVADSDNVGVYLKDGTGNALTSTLIAGAQNLNVTNPSDKLSGATFVSGTDYGVPAWALDSTGKYAPLNLDASGNLKVDAVFSAAFDFAHAENSTHTVGDVGSFSLAYRQDTLVTDITATGDYAGMKSNNRGALWVAPVGTVADGIADTENPSKVGTRSAWGALSAITANNNRADMISDKYRRMYVNNGSNIGSLPTPVSVGLTAAALLASQLPGRRTILIQNNSKKPIYIGSDNTVTAATGIVLQGGADMPMDIGQDIVLWAIGSAAGQDVRVFETA
jgi:hypothetical protein